MANQSNLVLFVWATMLGVLLFSGCRNPDQKPLTLLFEQIGEHVTGKLRPEITALPSEQRFANLVRDQCRDECNVIDNFLASEPSLKPETMAAVFLVSRGNKECIRILR